MSLIKLQKTKIYNLSLIIAILLCSCKNVPNKNDTDLSKNSNKEFYSNGTARLQTKAELDSFIIKANRRTNQDDSKIVPEIMSERQSGDSTIYAVQLNIISTKNKMIGKALPDFSFKDLQDKTVKLTELKGKPIIINLWFVNCPPCIAEMPTLNSIKEKYSNTDIVFLSMTYETKEEVLKFLKAHPINYIIIPNIGDYHKILDSNFPQTIFVDRKGIIKDVQNGMIPIYDKALKKTSDKMDETDFIESLNAIK